MKKYMYTLSFLLLFLANNMFAQSEEKNTSSEFFKSTKIDIETSNCTEEIDKNAIIEKEFADTKFTLDTKKKQIIVEYKNQSDSKVIEYKLNNTKLIFKDQEEYGKSEAYITMVNNSPVLKFKDHSDDCFFYVVNFSK